MPMRLIATLTLLSLLAGCGGGDAGPERYHVSGEVKWNGQLVGDGMIYFEPTQGNTGPAGFAAIRGGKYDTSLEGNKGHVGGKMLVRIVPGLAPDAPILDDNAPPAASQFPLWQEVVDLPKETTTRNFDIPQDAEKQLRTKQISDQA